MHSTYYLNNFGEKLRVKFNLSFFTGIPPQQYAPPQGYAPQAYAPQMPYQGYGM